MAFYVGQKVCAVKDDHPLAPLPRIYRGQVFTITKIFLSEEDNEEMLQFVERQFDGNDTLEPGFRAAGFRPICDRPTSIEIFKAMLNPKTAEIDA